MRIIGLLTLLTLAMPACSDDTTPIKKDFKPRVDLRLDDQEVLPLDEGVVYLEAGQPDGPAPDQAIKTDTPAQQVDLAKADLPKADLPRADAPPLGDGPKGDVPKSDGPLADAPKADAKPDGAVQANDGKHDGPGPVGHLVINEVDYDQVLSDTKEFVEIYNGTGTAVSLANLALVFINGNNSQEYLRVALGTGTLPSGGYLVVGSATVTVPAGVVKVAFTAAQDSIQNGAPDGVALVNTSTKTVIDALSYEGPITQAKINGFTGTFNLVEGTVLPATVADSNDEAASLCRLPNGTDTNNAATDWKYTKNPTPGAANVP